MNIAQFFCTLRIIMVSILVLSQSAHASTEITSEKAYDEHTKKGIVVVEFYTEECPICKMAASTLKELETNHPQITFLKLNVYDPAFETLVVNEGVQAVPTFLIFRNGEKVNKVVGNVQDLKTIIEKMPPC